MARLPLLALALLAVPALAKDAPLISYTPPLADGDEDVRPVITAIRYGPQGTDYAFQLDFDRPPYGAGCRTRCASATVFLDTDDRKTTGLTLADPKAAESGADLAITIKGVQELDGTRTEPRLKVKVLQYAEGATGVDEGSSLLELDAATDTERVLVHGNTVLLLIDGNHGTVPAGKRARVVYHPPGSPALSKVAKGLSAGGTNRVQVFKKGKLASPGPEER